MNGSSFWIGVGLGFANLFVPISRAEGPTSRPADPWVFRSVLDNHPRMITIALHGDMWLAFDAQACVLKKAWAGGVKLTGSVYDTKHGPQPTSVGQGYLEVAEAPSWSGSAAGQPVALTATYRGYVLQGTGVVLKYDLAFPDGTIASVEDAPEHATENDRTTLVRKITLRGLGEGRTIDFAVPGLKAQTLMKIDGVGKLVGSEQPPAAPVVRIDRDGATSLVLSWERSER
ncbi:MAG TPA: hypothetical protein VGB55_11940 [Tepidisphaeraceae bacterium]|jgi:cytochrome c